MWDMLIRFELKYGISLELQYVEITHSHVSRMMTAIRVVHLPVFCGLVRWQERNRLHYHRSA